MTVKVVFNIRKFVIFGNGSQRTAENKKEDKNVNLSRQNLTPSPQKN